MLKHLRSQTLKLSEPELTRATIREGKIKTDYTPILTLKLLGVSVNNQTYIYIYIYIYGINMCAISS
jgi:hypothetical protein